MMNISELGPPDDRLLDDDENYVYYPKYRRHILFSIVTVFTVCLILIGLTTVFVFLFTRQQHSLPSIQGNVRVKAGQLFGSSVSEFFDDSTVKNFTTSHRLRGIIMRMDSECLGWFQCFYSSDSHPDEILRGETHGLRGQTDVGEEFWLDHDEKFSKVQIKVEYIQLFKDGHPTIRPRLIQSLRFFTTKGRSTPSMDQFNGDTYTEEFEGYTIGYLTGTSSSYIDQVQFYWYQTIPN